MTGVMLDELPQARSARRLSFLPAQPTGPAAVEPAAAPPASQAGRRPQHLRRRILYWSLALCVLPLTAVASLYFGLITSLSQGKARLGNLRSFMGKDEATAARGRETLGGLVANYKLVVDREFAEKAYVLALSSLERARVGADRQQRYLAAFLRPTLPEEALYPRRIVPSTTVYGIALVPWALGVLIVYAIPDHAV